MKRAILAIVCLAVVCSGCSGVPCFRGVLHLETCSPASSAAPGAIPESVPAH